jgi:ribonuclease HI
VIHHTAFTDGSGTTGGPGGWAVVYLIEENGQFLTREVFGWVPEGATNNRMELLANIQALENLTPFANLDVYADSAYVVNGIRERWWDKWLQNGWRNSKKEPVANADLWMRLMDAVILQPYAQVRHLNGHQADGGDFSITRGNRRADYLAGWARRKCIEKEARDWRVWNRTYRGPPRPAGGQETGKSRRKSKD